MEGDVHRDEDEAMALEGARTASTAKTLVLVKDFSMDMGNPMHVDVVLIMARDGDGAVVILISRAMVVKEDTQEKALTNTGPISNVISPSIKVDAVQQRLVCKVQIRPCSNFSQIRVSARKKGRIASDAKVVVTLMRSVQQILIALFVTRKIPHMSSKCPITKMPKPTASSFGSGRQEFGFIRISDTDYKLETPDTALTALLKVTGG
jgi:hypothetical protein